MMKKCPGQMSPRDLDSEMVRCPSCQRMVELFSDEPKHRCRCGRLLVHSSLPKCADWCPAAAECFGEAIDVRELKRRLEWVKNDPRAHECLDRVKNLKEKKEDGRDK